MICLSFTKYQVASSTRCPKKMLLSEVIIFSLRSVFLGHPVHMYIKTLWNTWDNHDLDLFQWILQEKENLVSEWYFCANFRINSNVWMVIAATNITLCQLSATISWFFYTEPRFKFWWVKMWKFIPALFNLVEKITTALAELVITFKTSTLGTWRPIVFNVLRCMNND